MAIGASVEFDLKKLDSLWDKIRKTQDEVNDMRSAFSEFFDDLRSATTSGENLSGSLKSNGLLDMIKQTIKLKKGFNELKSYIANAMFPLSQGVKWIGSIFSTIRSIAMLPLSILPSFGDIKNAISSMFNFAQEQTGAWWTGQTRGAATKNIMAIESTDRAFGMNGLLDTLSDTFSKNILKLDKHGGFLAAGGITNDDIAKWSTGGDSVENMLSAIGKIVEHGRLNNRDYLSESFYEEAKVGDSLGIDYTQFVALAKNLKDINGFYNEQKRAIVTSDKTMLNVSKTSERLNTAFHNIKTMLVEKFGPPITKMINALIPFINDLAKTLFSGDGMKAFSTFLSAVVDQLKDFLQNGGFSKLKEWAVTLSDVFSEIVYSIAKGFNKIGLMSDDTFRSAFKDKIAQEEYADKVNDVFKNAVGDAWYKGIGLNSHQITKDNIVNADNWADRGHSEAATKYVKEQNAHTLAMGEKLRQKGLISEADLGYLKNATQSEGITQNKQMLIIDSPNNKGEISIKLKDLGKTGKTQELTKFKLNVEAVSGG